MRFFHLGLAHDGVPVLLQAGDDGGVGHGRGVAKVCLALSDAPEDATHDLARAGLG